MGFDERRDSLAVLVFEGTNKCGRDEHRTGAAWRGPKQMRAEAASRNASSHQRWRPGVLQRCAVLLPIVIVIVIVLVLENRGPFEDEDEDEDDYDYD